MNLKTFIWLVILAWVWGPAFMLIKIAVYEIPPLTLIAGRLTLAALVLYLVLRFQGRRLPGWGTIWKHFAVVGLASSALPFALISWGEQHIDSALAAILTGTTPLFTMILAHYFTTDDRLTPAKIAGMLIGFGGLILLLAPALFDGLQASTWGLLATLLAAVSYGVGIVYARQNLRGLPPLVVPTAQLLLAALYLLPLAWVIERPYSLPLPSWPTLAAVLALAVVSTDLAFVLYYRVMETASATSLSMIAYLVPIVGTILGVVLLDEQLGWLAYLGCGLILLGIMAVNNVFQWGHWRHLHTAPQRP
jgi:drug/metabolite transporter (DMT)-like permease